MELQKLYSYVRQAIENYGMIREGDHIAVGISGGKDSLTLLYALAGLRKFYPQKFTITAITVHLGLPGMEFAPVRALCEQLDVPYEIVETRIGEIVFDVRKEKHPCALCAKLRKGALNEKALALGCNKIAYAHHRDDFVDTLFLSLFQEGRIASLSPHYVLERTGLTLIRPMMLVPEAQIRGFCKKYQLPVVTNNCTADGNTAREKVKRSIRQLQQEYPDLRERAFTAICKADFDDWMKDE
ncbi:MAG: tRNA 2-thiocytidine biosynthesis TtcA family protein [Lachnospiraceae bacterium]